MRDLSVAVRGQLDPIHLKGKCLNIGLEKAEQEEGLRNSDGVKDESGGVQEDLRIKNTIKIQARLGRNPNKNDRLDDATRKSRFILILLKSQRLSPITNPGSFLCLA